MESIFSPVNSIWDFLLRLYIVISVYIAFLFFIFLISKVRTELKLIFFSHEEFKKYYNSRSISETDHEKYKYYSNHSIDLKTRLISAITIILVIISLSVIAGFLWPLLMVFPKDFKKWLFN